MNLRDLPNLSKLDKQVITAIDETPFQLLLDKFNDPSESAVTRVCGAIGLNPSDWYDRVDVYRSLARIRTKITERAQRPSNRPTAQSPQPQTEAQPA